MAVPVGPIIAGLMSLRTSGKARWILKVLLDLISRMKSPSIKSLMVNVVPKVLEASFARMTIEDGREVVSMLRSQVEKFTVSETKGRANAENRFKQKLQETGLLTEVPTLYGSIEGDRTPVKVEGGPVSQTIIEKRR